MNHLLRDVGSGRHFFGINLRWSERMTHDTFRSLRNVLDLISEKLSWQFLEYLIESRRGHRSTPLCDYIAKLSNSLPRKCHTTQMFSIDWHSKTCWMRDFSFKAVFCVSFTPFSANYSKNRPYISLACGKRVDLSTSRILRTASVYSKASFRNIYLSVIHTHTHYARNSHT